MTLEPIKNSGANCILEGRYEFQIEELKESIPVSITYDASNSVYKVDAGKDIGIFKATCFQESSNQVMASVTIGDPKGTEILHSLTETEIMFLRFLYMHARLTVMNSGYIVDVVKTSPQMLDGVQVAAIPSKKMDSYLLTTNAFTYAGKLIRKTNCAK